VRPFRLPVWAGYQDELAGSRLCGGGLLTPAGLAGSAVGVRGRREVPGTMSLAELAGVFGVTPGRGGSLARGERKHPVTGHG
jgi:hypothetical protein